MVVVWHVFYSTLLGESELMQFDSDVSNGLKAPTRFEIMIFGWFAVCLFILLLISWGSTDLSWTSHEVVRLVLFGLIMNWHYDECLVLLVASMDVFVGPYSCCMHIEHEPMFQCVSRSSHLSVFSWQLYFSPKWNGLNCHQPMSGGHGEMGGCLILGRG